MHGINNTKDGVALLICHKTVDALDSEVELVDDVSFFVDAPRYRGSKIWKMLNIFVGRFCMDLQFNVNVIRC